jgi:predicted outer membrane repeat protein
MSRSKSTRLVLAVSVAAMLMHLLAGSHPARAQADWSFEFDAIVPYSTDGCISFGGDLDGVPWSEVAYGRLSGEISAQEDVGYCEPTPQHLIVEYAGQADSIAMQFGDDEGCLEYWGTWNGEYVVPRPQGADAFRTCWTSTAQWCSGGDCEGGDDGYHYNCTLELFRRTTWHVSPNGNDSTGDGSADSPFATLLHGLALAAAGDTVQLAPGIYPEHDVVLKAGVLINGVPDDPMAVVIDAQQAGRVFRAFAVDSTASICGVTITGGRADFGAGLFCTDSGAPLLRSCMLSGNTATIDGGAVRCNRSAAIFRNCTFTGNSATGHGGALYFYDDSDAILDSCTIADNSAANGGGLRCNTSSLQLTACVITGNAAHLGGGVYLYNGSAAILQSCTVAGNAASEYGGGLRCLESTVSLARCIIFGNCAPEGSQLQIADPQSTASLACCAVDTTPGWNDGNGQVTWVNPNVGAPPLFCEPVDCQAAPTDAGNYALRPDSPCLPGGNACGVLIGAAGLGCEVPPAAVVHVAPWGDDVNGDGSAGDPVRTIQRGIDLAADLDTVLVASGTYTGPGNREIDFLGKAITVRSAAGDPELCIIDCAASDPYTGFYFHTAEDSSSVLDGFTIQNGVATHQEGNLDRLVGGGIFCDGGTAPLLQNLILRGNDAGFAGAGLAVFMSAATIRDCRIIENHNGGAFVSDWALFERCEIADNTGQSLYLRLSNAKLIDCTITGDEFYVYGGGDIEVRGCAIAAPMHGHHGTSIAFHECSLSGELLYFFEAGIQFHGCTLIGSMDGALLVDDSWLTMTDCLLAGNRAANGAAIRLVGHSSGHFLRCRFADNAATGSGGALHTNSADGLELVDCEFLGNSAAGGVGGGAIALASMASSTAFSATGCSFAGNSALGGSPGGAISCTLDSGNGVQLVDCLLVGNFSEGDGGGLYLMHAPYATSQLSVAGSTFSGNRSLGAGGGIAGIELDAASFANTILWGNCAGTAGDQLYMGSDMAAVDFACCAVDSAGVAGGAVTYGADTLFSDPRFCDPRACSEAPYLDTAGFALRDDSPCLAANNDCGELIGALGAGCPLTGVASQPLPGSPRLAQNHPNPFNARTNIVFTLPDAMPVDLRVYDLAGRERAVLLAGVCCQAGTQHVVWNGRDTQGRALPSGVYLYRLQTLWGIDTRKMTLLQ